MKKIIVFLLICLVCLPIYVCAETVVKYETEAIFTDVTRTGLFTGEINQDGKPDGFGVFEAVNSEGIKYVVVSEWKDGKQNGYGWTLWESGDFNIGEYLNGRFILGKYGRNNYAKEYNILDDDDAATNTEAPESNEDNTAVEDNEIKPDYTSAPVISYSDLRNYKKLYEPDMKYDQKYGKNLVRIEAVIGYIQQENMGYTFTLWIKDNDRYVPVDQDVRNYDESSKFPVEPVYGQRVIYTLYPTEYGTIYGEAVQDCEIIEQEADVKTIVNDYLSANTIPYEDLIRYKELYAPDLVEGAKGKERVKIVAVVGDITQIYDHGKYKNYDYDLWIKGDAGYYRISMNSNTEPVVGQWVVYIISPYGDGHFTEAEIDQYNVLVLGIVDLNTIKEKGIETDRSKMLLSKSFDINEFETIEYKKIMRRPGEYAEKPIKIEAICKQQINDNEFLIADAEDNYFHMFISDGIIDYRLLEDDRIIIYGYIEEDEFSYTTVRGEKKSIPSVFARSIELLE